jgi:hypothetical protein
MTPGTSLTDGAITGIKESMKELDKLRKVGSHGRWLDDLP